MIHMLIFGLGCALFALAIEDLVFEPWRKRREFPYRYKCPDCSFVFSGTEESFYHIIKDLHQSEHEQKEFWEKP